MTAFRFLKMVEQDTLLGWGERKKARLYKIYGHLIPNLQDGVTDLLDELITPLPIKLGISMEANALSRNLESRNYFQIIYR